ncbi:MAG: glycosyltransferase family 4 protein [Bacteroidetes bacterium]|nr:glycosyltransferase family 4 protein [Bacteroidota bacterium]
MKKKVRILFTIPNFITAGSGMEMLNIIERLETNIFEPVICVQQEGGALFEYAKNRGLEIIVHPFSVENPTGLFNTIKQAKLLATYFKPFQFDIWQSFNWSSDYSEALVARYAGSRYVYVKKNMNWGRKAWKIKSFLSKKIVARNSTMFFTFFKPPYLNRKTVFITGGVNTDKYSPARNSVVKVRYNIPSHHYTIICVAQIIKSKDQLTLIDAVKELDNVSVLFVGAERDEAYATELKNKVEEYRLTDRIHFLGAVSNISELLNGCDAFVLPTTNTDGHEEGCPVALLEAMSVGLPCIASNVAGNRDLIVTNKTGLLFKPGNSEELKACIEKYRNDDVFAKQMGENAAQMVKTEHTLDIEARAFSAMYKKMMGIK